MGSEFDLVSEIISIELVLNGSTTDCEPESAKCCPTNRGLHRAKASDELDRIGTAGRGSATKAELNSAVQRIQGRAARSAGSQRFALFDPSFCQIDNQEIRNQTGVDAL
jgi:hypothetical protein